MKSRCLLITFWLLLTHLPGVPAQEAAPDTAIPNAPVGRAKDLSLVPISEARNYNKKALVIGINEYSKPIPSLSAGVADAKAFADFLEKEWGFPHDNITLLTDEGDKESRPTTGNILRAADLFIKNVKREDEVVFFYSGHGTRSNDADYLVPCDAYIEDIGRTGLNFDTWRAKLQGKRPTRAFVVTDACRSLLEGKTTGKGSGFGTSEPAEMREFAEMRSCAPSEISYEMPDGSGSVFTHYLLKGLSGEAEARNGDRVTYDSLMSYVSGNVGNYVLGNFKAAQNPEGSASLGLMVLASFEPIVPIEPIVPPPPPNAPKPMDIPNATRNGQGGRSVDAIPLPIPIIPIFINKPLPNLKTKFNAADGAAMVWVSPGKFLRGFSVDEEERFRKDRIALGQPEWVSTDRKPAKPEPLDDGYWIYKNEVTVAQYKKFCAATARAMPMAPRWGWKDTHPIVNVSQSDARAYCEWAGAALPTEWQWEKAAQGPKGTLFPWGESWPQGRAVGNFPSGEFGQNRFGIPVNDYNDEFQFTAPVGSFPDGASPYGCLDMAGNVWEWCADTYDVTLFPPVPSGTAAKDDSGLVGVLRGGSWYFNFPQGLKAGRRYRAVPSTVTDYNGFRCVVNEK